MATYQTMKMKRSNGVEEGKTMKIQRAKKVQGTYLLIDELLSYLFAYSPPPLTHQDGITDTTDDTF